jgi:hypothetical protein
MQSGLKTRLSSPMTGGSKDPPLRPLQAGLKTRLYVSDVIGR